MCRNHEEAGRIDADCPCSTGTAGHWIRQGNHIVVALASRPRSPADDLRREADPLEEQGETGRMRGASMRGSRFRPRGPQAPGRGRGRPRRRRPRWARYGRTLALANGVEEDAAFVRWVQSTLNRILDAQMPVDGIMSSATRHALRAFQRRHGLPVDGAVGPDTERALAAAARRNRTVQNA